MKHLDKLYINGAWVEPGSSEKLAVVNPFTEEVVAEVASGTASDVDKAVAAAKEAFRSWRNTSSEERERLINAIADRMEARADDLTRAISDSMGSPYHLARDIHVMGPIYGMRSFAARAKLMDESEKVNNSLVVKEPVGVCGFITPWNYPLHQFVGKVAPALAAGCTMIQKPSEQTPLQDYIMAEIMQEAGVPAGVFNLVPGTGPVVGAALSAHPDISMVSFTGSTRAGIEIAKAAAPTVKRVTQELGGKSPLLIAESANLEEAVKYGCDDVFINTGQTCTALTRMLVPESRYEEAVALAKANAEAVAVGGGDDAFMGPMSSARQKRVVLDYIQKGIDEGARLVTGGTDMPEGQARGFYVRPTVFADVNNEMAIAREEIFGPVISMIPYRDLDEALAIANDTSYGLSSGVFAGTDEEALAIARRLDAGLCFMNGGDFNYDAPFGGMKQSGNGREFGSQGLEEFTEVKAIQMPS
ncbi:aldehyde dehydrogenase family protein [Biformimicrobium ophioploci]|uniref:aldehyde dehydrogenase (NAD(+)) n=1 Tax=Biformimicrobium ophioploci TaxID=3036711 RepID=A0ABQ6M2E9_9GAMM|nr:aldehyde dehydrogenase family protein [Microbulbifer sp. NKW57]GMG88526.1 aldehyde dehydrogenase family protein [Microbulbifer sp. NKW57]